MATNFLLRYVHLDYGYMPCMAYSQYCVKLNLWLIASMAQTQDKFIARLPDGMRERLKKAADRNRRSMNAELVNGLEFYLGVEEYNFEIEEAHEFWLKNPDHKPDEFPELSSQEMPATKGDIERILITIQKFLAKK